MLQGIRDAVIRDTVAAVFRDPAYSRDTVLSRIGSWLVEFLQALFARFDRGQMSIPLFWLVWGLVALLLLALAARLLYSLATAYSAPRRRALKFADADAPGVDAWRMAMRHAEAGDYTAAAHALYAALLATLAAETDVELHESKTIGDYLRDLSRRSYAMLSRFREFARTYETVIYGLGSCDRARYERLLGLAQQIAGTRA
jgi:hypothetical protein